MIKQSFPLNLIRTDIQVTLERRFNNDILPKLRSRNERKKMFEWTKNYGLIESLKISNDRVCIKSFASKLNPMHCYVEYDVYNVVLYKEDCPLLIQVFIDNNCDESSIEMIVKDNLINLIFSHTTFYLYESEIAEIIGWDETEAIEDGRRERWPSKNPYYHLDQIQLEMMAENDRESFHENYHLSGGAYPFD